MNLKTFFTELKRRNVYKVAIAYANQVDRGGVDALLGDYTIRKVVPPHQKRTIDIKVKYWEITADTLSKAGSSVP